MSVSLTSPAVAVHHPYRWVIAIAGGFGVGISVIAIPVFGSAIPVLAQQWGSTVGKVASFGMDSFALGVLFAFLVSHSGIFHGRTKIGMTLVMVAQVVPLLLIPRIEASYWLLALLRFLMGWGLAGMGLQAALMSRWFGHGERAISMAFPVGLGIGALVPGGYIASMMPRLGLQRTFAVAALAVFVCYVINMAFSRDPTELPAAGTAETVGSMKRADDLRRVWTTPEIWLLGIGGNTQTWAMFTVGAFLPVFFIRVGHISEEMTGQIMSAFGIFAGVIALSGAAVSTYVLKRLMKAGARTAVETLPLRVRLLVMIGTNVMMFCGFLLLFYLSRYEAGHVGVGNAVLAVLLLSFLALNATAFWVAIGDLFPHALQHSTMVAVAVLGAGLVAQIGSALGPFLSSALAESGWPVTFLVAAGVQGAGIAATCIILARSVRSGRLPFAGSLSLAREAVPNRA